MAVQTYFMAGEQLNVLGTALSVASTSADALFPLANLYIGRPSRPFRFNANGADLVITAGINRVINGGFETGTLDGWIDADTGDGVTSKDTVIFDTGAASMKGTVTAAGVASRYRDFTFRAGERIRFDG